MTKKILIDAGYSEETRVVSIENNKIQDFDRESRSFKQLKGNIYIAKITRIEPSLQAAFVDYGGDRHGFLPLADVHHDYFNIADKSKTDLSKVKHFASEQDLKNLERKAGQEFKKEEISEREDDKSDLLDEEAEVTEENQNAPYKKIQIQDVLKEGQFLLVQVLKEERGNKGVALTTFVSLAGKYCVLMINSVGKGGVSKKIDNLRDRKILKNIIRSFRVPRNQSVIIRTAGVGQKPEEILRDYMYLTKLWNNIKKASIESKNPTFIHAEDDVIKRCIRDMYDETVSEIMVEGEEAFKTVKALVNMVTPQRKNVVTLYNERTPIFHRYNIEQQILELYRNKITLPSGASIVIDQTEALVAIDVNSGKATKEQTVEEMATTINIEAAKEIARQLKLKDLAGLIVIDFIDMFDPKNRRTVERTLRDALMNDKARTQIAKLSMFGLLEMSRQRLAGNLVTKVSEPCSCCKGTGVVRSREVVALNILRAVRATTNDKSVGVVHIFTSEKIASYMMNYKREEIRTLEQKCNIYVFLNQEENLENLYYLRTRKKLNDEELKELCPKVATGKVKVSFKDEPYCDVRGHTFGRGCYFEEEQQKGFGRKMKHKKGRDHKDMHQKPAKTEILKKITKIFKRHD